MSQGDDVEAVLEMLELMAMQNTSDVMRGTEYMREALADPEVMVELMEIAQAVEEVPGHLRQLALVLFRKKVTGHWMRFSLEQQRGFKDTLLGILTSEDEQPDVMRAASEVAALIGKHELPEDQWDELMDTLFDLCEATSARQRQNGLHVFVVLLDSIPLFMQQHFDAMTSLVASLLADEAARVRKEAVEATSKLIFIASRESELARGFQDTLLEPLINLITAEINESEDDEIALAGLRLLSEFAPGSGRKVIEGEEHALVDYVLEIGTEPELEPAIRQTALSFVINLCIFAPTLIYKYDYADAALDVALSMASEAEDEDSVELCNFKFGCQMCDHLATNLPPGYTFDRIMAYVRDNSEEQEEDARNSAIAVLGVVTEPFADDMRLDLAPYVECVEGILGKEPSGRLVSNMCMTLAEMAEHTRPEIGAYHDRVVPLLMDVIDRTDKDDIVSLALHAMEHFMEVIGSEAQVYMDDVVPLCLDLVSNENSSAELAQVALSALAEFAAATNSHFTKYAEEVMGVCVDLMGQVDDDLLTLRAMATETAGLVLLAVGPEFAEEYIDEVVDLGVRGFKLQYYQLRELTFSMFNNLAELMEEEFEQHMSTTITLAVASMMSADGYTEQGDDAAGGISDDEGTDMRLPRFIAAEKAAAVYHLGKLAACTREAFDPWFTKSVDAVEALSSHHSEEVRMTLVRVMQQFVEWQLGMEPTEMPDTLGRAMEIWVGYLVDDEDKEVTARCAECLTWALGEFGGEALASEKQLDELVSGIELVLKREHSCYDGDDYDEEEPQHDMVVIDVTVDMIAVLMRAVGEEGVEALQDTLLDPLLVYLEPHHDERDKYMAIAAISDITTELGAAMPSLERLFGLVLEELKETESSKIRHNAAYTVGVLAEALGPQQPECLAEALEALVPVYEDPTPGVQDNVCGAIARLITTGLEELSVERAVEGLLMGMPLKEDFEEQESAFRAVFTLFREADFGDLVPYVPAFFEVFGRVLGGVDGATDEGISDDVKLEMCALVIALLESEEVGDAVQGIVDGLDADVKSGLMDAVEWVKENGTD